MKRGYDTLDTEIIGTIGFIVSEQGVEEIFLTEDSLEAYLLEHPHMNREEALCHHTKNQLDAYFKGERLTFDLPLVIEGTPFRKQVWEALRRIPYGETRSYGQIAEMIGHPKAVRAVGGANHANRLPLMIPCHRVTGANGKLVGFMGERVDLQMLLLAHEKKVLQLRIERGDE